MTKPKPTLSQYRAQVRTQGYRDGIRAAADFMSQFDPQINHAWKIQDVILCKFNLLPKKKMRKNSAKPDPSLAQVRTAVADYLFALGEKEIYAIVKAANKLAKVLDMPNGDYDFARFRSKGER